MKVVIFIENDVYPLDFAIAYELLSQAGADVQLVAEKAGLLTTSTGLNISVKQTLSAVEAVDLLWVCGGFSYSDINVNTLNWLNLMANAAQYKVAICSGVNHLIDADVLQESIVSLNKAGHKKYKKSNLKPTYQSLVDDANVMSVSSHGEILTATLLIIEKFFGAEALATIKNRLDIVDFSKLPQDDRAARKASKENDKYSSRYLKELKKAPQQNNCVLYAYQGMSALDYLTIDAFASHMGYAIQRIADRRGTVETLRGGYSIVVDDAIQNHRKAQLLFVPGGDIDRHMVNQFLIHWFTGICSVSYRIMTTGSAEQLLGITGLLREIDPDVLDNLVLGEGKYMMVANFSEVAHAMLNIAKSDNVKHASQIERFYWLGLSHKLQFRAQSTNLGF